jgi:hypothetical protein
MTTVLVRFRVADFDNWRRGYEADLAGPLGKDVLSSRIWRGQDEPNLVMLEETFESRDAAEAAVSDPAVLDAMARDGVDAASAQLDYWTEVSASAR